MFDAQVPDERSPLIAIADGLARQCEDAGRFALATDDWTDDFYVNQIAGHVSVIRTLLLGFEQLSPVVMSDPDLPYLFQPKLTPGSHPPGGYCRWEPGLDPKTYLESLITAWSYQIDQKTKDASHWLALRGALWVTANHSSRDGIRYLFSLARHGWLIYEDAFCEALRLLVRAACLAGDREAVVSLFFQVSPRTSIEWHGLLMKLSASILEPTSVCGDESVLELLVTEGLALATETKNASSYDSWLSSHLSLRPILQSIFRAVRDVCPSPHATLKMVLDQLEEALADSGSTRDMIRSNRYGTPLIHASHLAASLARMLKAKAGVQWKQRAGERPAIPKAILTHIEGDNLDDLPGHWKYASPAFAWALTTCFRTVLPTALVRSSNIPHDRVLAAPQREPLLASLLGDERQPEFEKAILRRVSEYHSPRPLSFSLRKLQRALARNSDGGEVAKRAPRKFDDELSDATEEWLEANDEAIRVAVSAFVQSYWIAEIKGYVDKAQQIQASDPRGAVRLLREGVKNYPWCEFIHYELAIVSDEHDDPPQAIQSISSAVFLRPGMHMFWESLGVILRRNGHVKHGNLASVVGEYLSASGD
jgi:hypothetical protein